MNAAYLHLFLTHAPFFGVLFAIFLLLLGLFRKSAELQRLSLWLFIFAAVLTVPAYLTGAPANTQLKNLLPTLPPDPADQHAEIAILALVAVLFAGFLALAGAVMFTKEKPVPNWFAAVLLSIALLSTATLGWTSNLGAKVRHTELRNAAAPGAPAGH